MPLIGGRFTRRDLITGTAVLPLSGIGSLRAHGAQNTTIVIGAESAIPPLDPHRVVGTVGLEMVDAIFDPLVREDLDHAKSSAPQLVPALAESWSTGAEGKSFTFRIRKNVSFHDGAPLNAAAIERNFQRLLDKASPFYDARASGSMAFLTSWIHSVEVADDSTVVFHLKDAFAGFPRLLSDRHMSIVSPQALSDFKGDALGQHPVGTGPFRLDRFVMGQALRLDRNPAFWGSTGLVDRIVFLPVLDPTAMAISLQTGQVDIVINASAQQIAQLKDDASVVVQFPDPANAYFVSLNCRSAVVGRREVRQAMNYAVNREAIAALFGGLARPLGYPVPQGNEVSSNAPADTYDYRPDKAKALLKAAGISLPMPFRLKVPSSGPGFGMASSTVALIQQDFAAVGIELQPSFTEFAALMNVIGAGYKDDIDGVFNGWTTGADSGFWLERMFGGGQQPPRGVNRGWYQSAAVDALFAEARAQVDETGRIKLYQHAADLISADAPWIFLYQDRLPRMFRKRITGLQAAPSVFFDYTALAVS